MNFKIVNLLKFLACLLILTTLVRAGFYFKFLHETSHDFWGWVPIFLNGIRFDLSAILYVNTLFLLVYLILPKRYKTIDILHAGMNTVFIIVLASDFYFYQSYGKKMEPSFWLTIVSTELSAFIETLQEYTTEIFLIFFIGVGFYFLIRYILKPVKRQSMLREGLTLFVFLLVAFLGIRGGLQKRVLGPQHKLLYTHGDFKRAMLASNTFHELLRSKNKKYFNISYLKKKDQGGGSFNSPLDKLHIIKPKNVLVIFMESLSEYAVDSVGFKLIDKLPKKDVIYLPDMNPSGEISMDAFVSLLFGVPSHFGVHLFNTKFVSNYLHGLPKELGKRGVENFYIGGAPVGSQFFDAIATAAGIKNQYSVIRDYEVPPEMRAPWGVHDEFLYEKTQEIIGNKYKDKSFFGVVFTASSHFPFKSYPGKDLEGSISKNYLKIMNYSQSAVAKFFDSIKSERWFNETLFIVLGDHLPPINQSWNKLLHNGIPLLMYYPNSGISSLEIVDHPRLVDLNATLYSFLKVQPEKLSKFSRSIFSKSKKSNELHFFADAGRVTIREGDLVKHFTHNEFVKNRGKYKPIFQELSRYAQSLRDDDLYFQYNEKK